jgi:PTS system mannose-specific IIB component/fructoselysine and glucoselysine-specific PTS system IIB component
LGIVLYRVDERLIHGQVVIGWGSQLVPKRYLVVDDALAASDWEQELYHLSLPEGVTGEFVTTAQAIDALPRWQKETVRSVLLTRDVRTMLALAEAGLLNESAVNIGGIHHAPGRRRVRPYVYLDDEDRERLGRLGELGLSVTARDLPGSVGLSLEGLLKE